MIKLIKLRPDGTFKDFFCNNEKEAEAKIKHNPDMYFYDSDFVAPVIEDEKIEDLKIEIITEDDEVKIQKIVGMGYTREHAISVVKEV